MASPFGHGTLKQQVSTPYQYKFNDVAELSSWSIAIRILSIQLREKHAYPKQIRLA